MLATPSANLQNEKWQELVQDDSEEPQQPRLHMQVQYITENFYDLAANIGKLLWLSHRSSFK